MASSRRVNKRYCTNRIHVDYAHVGLFDVADRSIWIAKRRPWGMPPIRVSHARMLLGGSNTTAVADKDRFICFWFHTPGSGEGYVHGYPIEWEEGHLLIRLDPNWNYLNQQFVPNTDTARIEKNTDMQFDWGRQIFEAYAVRKPRFALSYHMIGPRPADSMFYVQRVESP